MSRFRAARVHERQRQVGRTDTRDRLHLDGTDVTAFALGTQDTASIHAEGTGVRRNRVEQDAARPRQPRGNIATTVAERTSKNAAGAW